MGFRATDLSIELLGRPCVRLAGGQSLPGVPRKLFPLLALLILEFQNEAARRVLAERLWETSSRRQMNANMRQMVAKARSLERQLGAPIFTATGDVISRNRHCLPTDLDAFLAEVVPTRPSSLLNLVERYGGALLESDDDVSSDLSSFLEFHRRRMRDRLVQLAVAGADQIGGEAAHRALSHLQNCLPHDDRVCRALLRHTAKMYGADQARLTYRNFANRLESELGVQPEDETKSVLHELWHEPSAKPRARADHPKAEQRSDRRLDLAPRLAILLPSDPAFQADATQLAMAQMLVEDITGELCRFQTLAVLAPYSIKQLKSEEPIEVMREFGIDYLATTRVRAGRQSTDPDALSLDVMLVEVDSRRMIWADKFPLGTSEAPHTHRRITSEIAQRLVEAVEYREIAATRVCENPSAFGQFLLGRSQLRLLDLPSVRRGRRYLREAIKLEPHFAAAHGWLGRSFIMEWELRAQSELDALEQATNSAMRAIDIDPSNYVGFSVSGRASLYAGRLEEGLHQLTLAVERAPQHADALADRADARAHASEIDAAEDDMHSAMLLNPMAPDEYHWTAGAIAFFKRDYERALAILKRMKRGDAANRLMAACAAMIGDRAMAARYRRAALVEHPEFTVSKWMQVMPQRDRTHREQYANALRLAGFP